MKAQKGWSCSVFILLHMTNVTWTQIFKVVSPSSAVLVFVGENVTLPASLYPTMSAQTFDVRWFRDDFYSLVLSYQDFQIRPERQSQAYKGRTVLFLEELLNGNVSLRLQDVRVSDGGLYKCFVDSGPWNDEVHITLNVEVLGDQPSISIGSTEHKQTKLKCMSEKWGTTPDLTWRDMNGVDVTSESRVTEERDNEGFLRVSSFLPVKQEFSVFSCLMRSKAPKPDWHSGLTIYVFSPGVPGWSVVFWLSLFLYVAVAGLLIFQWRRMKGHKARYESKAYFLQLYYLRKEIEKTKAPAFSQTIPKVLQRYRHEDLLKITEYFRPCLTYLIKAKMTNILESLVSKEILTNDEIVKVKKESEGTEGVDSFISEVMKKDRVVLISLWEALAEQLERFQSPNLIRLMEEVTEERRNLLEEIDSSVQSPAFDPHIKDLHATHRLTVSESTRTLEAQVSPGDPHTTAVCFETRYTELVVITQDTRSHKETEHELVKTGRIHGELMEEGAAEKCERIWIEQLFWKSPVSVNPVNVIVVSGMVGIGKTTMVQKIMYDWARGTQYQRFAFVFLFKFRELNLLDNENETQMSLTKLIERHYKYLSNDPLKVILQKPETLLFIFDGLDEYKHKLDFTQSQLCSNPDVEVPVHILFTSLVRRTLLKGCSVLITSRPTALEAMDMERVDQFVEILGFFPEQRLTYCKKFFGDAALAAEASQYVEENTILYSMCFNPSFCWMICSVLRSHFVTPEKKHGACPRTVTEMFVMFLHNIQTNHRQEVKNQQMILVKLGKMAYYGLENRIHVFNETEEMVTFSLQPDLSSPFISGILQRQSTLEHTTYTFYQFNLQEFMAACSFYLKPSRDMEEILKNWDSCKDDRFEIAIRFIAGLAWCSVLKTVEKILGEFEGNTVKCIQEWVKQKAKRTLQGGDKSESLRVCYWLCETQNKELIRDAIGKDLKLDFRNTTLSAVDCAVLASVISCCGELKELNLSETPLTPECIRRLAEGFSCCSVVWLRSCNLSARCCSALSSALSTPNSWPTLLGLNENNMEDSGMEQLCEGLRSPNCKLKKLWLKSCGLTSACCSALSSVLSSPNSQLTYLSLSYNNLGDSGARQLSEGLRSDNCKLETLRLKYSGINDSEKRNLWSLEEELRKSGHQLTIST
uniref:NACHT, LRR and PYD domains-containing protein 3-like n=1 Tax=Erpetoichthys calabaricus TaxID=27687 RepID=A0A8C4T7S6_ERPCA